MAAEIFCPVLSSEPGKPRNLSYRSVIYNQVERILVIEHG